MQIVNNFKKENPHLEVGDVICFQNYGDIEYRLVCKSPTSLMEKYFTISLNDNTVQLTAETLEALWSKYKMNFDNDLHIIKSTYVKLVIE